MTSGVAPRRSVLRLVRTSTSLVGALLALGAGWWVAAVLGVRHPVPITVVLLVVPVLAVVVPARRLEPVARLVLAVGWVLSLNTVVAQTMLSFDAWNVPVGVLVVVGVSVLVWVTIELTSGRSERRAARAAAARDTAEVSS